MKSAFLFPGQGAELPRMGLDLAGRSKTARALLERAGARANVDLFRLLERGGRALDRTDVLQPAIIAVCTGMLAELLERGIRADFVAGHSLGELGAWCGAGCIDPETAVDLAAVRGRLMAEAAIARPGAMIALEGATKSDMEAALVVGRRWGWLDLAAHNGPAEWVLSGQLEALAAVAKSFPTRPVHVSGPWHSSAMVRAREGLLRDLQRVKWSDGHTAFVSSDSGRVASPDQIPVLLADQLIRPVLWATSMRTLVDNGVTDFVIVGPSKLMRSLVRANVGDDAQLHCAEDFADLQHLEEMRR